MIQRIQSVYLFLVAVCAVVCLCMPVGHFHQDGIGVADFYNLWLTMADGGASLCSVGHVCTVSFGSVHFVCSHIFV